jgi:hypothetical protein
MRYWKIAALFAASFVVSLAAHAAGGPAQLIQQARGELRASKLWGHAEGHAEKAEQALGDAQRLIEQDAGRGSGRSRGGGRGRGQGSGSGDGSGGGGAAPGAAKGDVELASKDVLEARDAASKMKLKDGKDIDALLATAIDEIKAAVAAEKKAGKGGGAGK